MVVSSDKSLDQFFFPFLRHWQQGVGRWRTTLYNVAVQQRPGLHAAAERPAGGREGFHSGKGELAHDFRTRGVRGDLDRGIYWIGEWSSGGRDRGRARKIHRVTPRAGAVPPREIFNQTLPTAYFRSFYHPERPEVPRFSSRLSAPPLLPPPQPAHF